MTRAVVIAVLLALGTPAMAQSQLERSTQRILDEFGFRNVDATGLTSAQLASIRYIAEQSGPRGGKRGQIRSVLNVDNLRSLLR